MKKNFVLVSLDCVRQESLSCYGKPWQTMLHHQKDLFEFRGARLVRPWAKPLLDMWKQNTMPAKTPNIDRLAAMGTQFTQAITQAPYTPASHASVFTGCNPYLTGIRRFLGAKLSDQTTTLAEIMRANGYATGGFVGANVLGDIYGFDRGFDIYSYQRKQKNFEGEWGNFQLSSRDHLEVTHEAISWIDSLEREEEPFFMFCHYFDAHEEDDNPSYQPYYQVKQMQGIDKSIGLLLDCFKNHGIYDNTVFIFFADHGNDFGVNEPGHRWYLYDTTLLVPLIISGKGWNGPSKRKDLVRLIDIAPTILDLAGIDHPARSGMEGINLQNTNEPRSAYSETFFEKSADEWSTPKFQYSCVRDAEWKLIEDHVNGKFQLFNIKQDPNEKNDLAAKNPQMVAQMTAQLHELRSKEIADEIPEMSEDEIGHLKDTLKNLGYM